MDCGISDGKKYVMHRGDTSIRTYNQRMIPFTFYTGDSGVVFTKLSALWMWREPGTEGLSVSPPPHYSTACPFKR
jgi:hypothetical protein